MGFTISSETRSEQRRKNRLLQPHISDENRYSQSATMSRQLLYTATQVVRIRNAVFRNATLEIDPTSDVDTRAALAADDFDAVARSEDFSAEKLQIKQTELPRPCQLNSCQIACE